MKNKRLEVRLDPTMEALLESLASRFNVSKQTIIRQALWNYAAKNKHVIKIAIYEDTKPDINYDKDIEEAIEIANTPWIKK